MSKEAIENRLTELKAALEQIQANGNATLGAIRECERWLALLEKSGEGEQPSPEKQTEGTKNDYPIQKKPGTK